MSQDDAPMIDQFFDIPQYDVLELAPQPNVTNFIEILLYTFNGILLRYLDIIWHINLRT